MAYGAAFLSIGSVPMTPLLGTMPKSIPYEWEMYAIQIAGVCRFAKDSQPLGGMNCTRIELQVGSALYIHSFHGVRNTDLGEMNIRRSHPPNT